MRLLLIALTLTFGSCLHNTIEISLKSTDPIELVEFVKDFESYKPNRYWDYQQWSIGYGCKAKKGERTISLSNAKLRLGVELEKSRQEVITFRNKHGYEWAPNQIDALTSFHFNIGTLRGLTNNGKRDDAEIAAMLPQYRKAGGEDVRGLVKRRKAEREYFQR